MRIYLQINSRDFPTYKRHCQLSRKEIDSKRLPVWEVDSMVASTEYRKALSKG